MARKAKNGGGGGGNIRWRNRIVGEGEKAASEFTPHPQNWRKHPSLQRQLLADILGEVGWVQRVIVNRVTGNTLDGHARIEEALAQGQDTPVPFVEVELSKAEERKILAVFDPIGALAAADVERLTALTETMDFDSAALKQLLGDLRGEEVNLDDFFKEKDAVGDGAESPPFTLTVEFATEDEYLAVITGLERIAPAPAEALKKLLQL